MILQLDIGNTRAKWRVVDGATVLFRGTGAPDSDDLFSDFPVEHRSTVKAIRVASVGGGAVQEALTNRLEAEFGLAAEFVQCRSEVSGLRVAYSDPASLGVDRWLAMLAIWKRYRSAFVIVDAGSALTIDYVDSLGEHVGGYILPGWRMQQRALLEGTAQVRFDARESVRVEPGKSTVDCVAHGRNWLWKALIERLDTDVREYRFERIVVTGGDAEHLIALGLCAEYWPDVVLDGLNE